MRSFFNPESPMMNVFQAIFDLFVLNICFIICSIPIFTIGAASTALYSVYFRTNDERSVATLYFQKFKENFKQSTIVWLILMVLGLLLYMDFRILVASDKTGFTDLLYVVVYFVTFILLGTGIYVFPLIAKFRDKTSVILKNSVLLSLSTLPKTIVMVFITIFPFLILLFSTHLFVRIVMPWVCVGFSGMASIKARMMLKTFRKLIEADEDHEK